MPDFAAVNRNLRELREDIAALQALTTNLKPLALRPSEKTTDTGKLKRLQLHIAMRDVFNDSELRLLAAELGINVGDLEGDTLTERCLSLALLMNRHGRFGELLTALSGQRPHVDWLAFE